MHVCLIFGVEMESFGEDAILVKLLRLKYFKFIGEHLLEVLLSSFLIRPLLISWPLQSLFFQDARSIDSHAVREEFLCRDCILGRVVHREAAVYIQLIRMVLEVVEGV